MRKRKIGSLDVSVVGIGCNNFGRELDLEQSRKIIDAGLDLGVNFFDTADVYGRPPTNSELVVGEILKSHRNEVLIATKFGRVLDQQRQGAKAAYVRSATEASLRRLQTDRIDLMQLHIPDLRTPIEETLGALNDLVAEGKVREIGASNFSADQLHEAAAAARKDGTVGFVSTQSEYSLLNRKIETGVLAECERSGVGLLPYLPLYNGLLTGRYRTAEAPKESRIGGKSDAERARIFSDRNMKIVAALTSFAESKGHTLLDLAFAWLLSNPSIPSIIAGVSSPAQVSSNVSAANWTLSASEIADIERIAPRAETTLA